MKQNKECCDKCYTTYNDHGYPDNKTWDACYNPNCECHICSTCKTNTLPKAKNFLGEDIRWTPSGKTSQKTGFWSKTNTLNKCEHEYEAGMVLAGKLNCKKCGLLKSTIESEVKPEGVGGWVEKLFDLIKEGHEAVVNHEEVAEYRQKVESFLSSLLLQEKAKCMADFEKRLEEYRNSPDVWKNVGISKWKNWGEQNNYFEFFKAKWKGKIEKLKEMAIINPMMEIKDSELVEMEAYNSAYNQATDEVIALIDKL